MSDCVELWRFILNFSQTLVTAAALLEKGIIILVNHKRTRLWGKLSFNSTYKQLVVSLSFGANFLKSRLVEGLFG